MSEPNYWLVGAARGGTEDKTDELVQEGVWRFWPDPEKPEQYRDQILSMKPGDKIAIKSAYKRKYGLPFDSRGHNVSVMAIKAVGEITENVGDGQTVKVDWRERFDPPREWYFFTGWHSVWQPNLERSWRARALVNFVFEGEEQDIDRFRNDRYWRDRFGDMDAPDARFGWTGFYQEFADQLLGFQERRSELVGSLQELLEAQQVPNLDYLAERDSNGEAQPIADICPFTFMGAFNRGVTVDNRRSVAAALARIVGVERDVPESFEGVPVLNNQKSWFFGPRERRGEHDIDNLWAVFRATVGYVDADVEQFDAKREELANLIDLVLDQRGVGWNLTMGMYWIRPWDLVPLDQNSRRYIVDTLGVELPHESDYRQMSGADYLSIVDELKARLEDEDSPVRSFPELSFAAWTEPEGGSEDNASENAEEEAAEPDRESYSLDDIEREGGFFPSRELERMLDRLKRKKNVILQGPPGTGKTWLSKRLAYALIGARADDQVIALQFHPTLSYEDFVRGWRPGADGRLELVDGPLMQAVAAARAKPDDRHVVVIEEINRGNPAQILGEMLTLLEADKRAPEHGLRLSHMREGEDPVHVPPNLFVIGTMNIADRSLALVDLALRRRFAFFTLEPMFNDAWAHWLENTAGLAPGIIQDIRSRMQRLNEAIAADDGLGPQFRVGHSYATPRTGQRIDDPRQWFEDIVKTEIAPLLEEYWFDRPDQAEEQTRALLSGW